MLTEVCNFIHNYFIHTTHEGEFTIADGKLDVDFLQNGQRFRIYGSVLNDGIYTYHGDNGVFDDDDSKGVFLASEIFTGAIIAMAVPRDVLTLVGEIADWCEANAAVLNSPYTSESFGGYSYTKATGTGANAGGALTWQDVFKSKLNAYRKIA